MFYKSYLQSLGKKVIVKGIFTDQDFSTDTIYLKDIFLNVIFDRLKDKSIKTRMETANRF